MPSSEDGNSSLSTLLTSVENVLNKHAPLKTLSKRQERIQSKPWITKGLLRSIRTKNKLYTNLHKKSVQDDHKWAEFRKYRNKLNRLIEKSKVNYYMQEIASSNNNSSLWKTIKNILNKGHKKQVHLQDLQNEDGKLTKSSKESADKINTYFSVVGKTLASKIPQPTVIPPSFQSNLNNSFFLQLTCPSEIEHVIKNLNSKKAIPLDHVPIKFIKMSSSILFT